MKFALDFQPKLFATLRNYDRRKFSADLMAGIIVGIVALPLAIAFGIASGVTPEKGLITAIIGGFLVSLLGGSSVQIGGPTGAFIVIVAGIIGKYGLEGLAIATIMAGIMLVLLGVLKLGVVIKFIPYPIIVGFTAGIALTIFSTQIKDLFGLQIAGPMPDDFISKWGVYFQHFDTTNLWALGIGLVSIAIILLTPKISSKVPGSLAAIILVTIACYASSASPVWRASRPSATATPSTRRFPLRPALPSTSKPSATCCRRPSPSPCWAPSSRSSRPP